MWTPTDGLMAYGEIRLRDVEEGREDLSSYVGHLVSPKIDGWHVVWDGKQLFSHSGKFTFPLPDEWRKDLPSGVSLSAELVVKGESATSVASLRKEDGPWERALLFAFDLPGREHRRLPFSERTKRLKQISSTSKRIVYVPQKVAKTEEDILRFFEDAISCRGVFSDTFCFREGIVLTDPDSVYEAGRAKKRTRAKLKRREDDEAIVVGHTGRSLRVRWKVKEFKIGIGITDEQREDLPSHFPVGTRVTFSFRTIGSGGKPLEPRLLGRRHSEDMRRRRTRTTKKDRERQAKGRSRTRSERKGSRKLE